MQIDYKRSSTITFDAFEVSKFVFPSARRRSFISINQLSYDNFYTIASIIWLKLKSKELAQ